MGFQNWIHSTVLVGIAKSCACLKSTQKLAQFVLGEGGGEAAPPDCSHWGEGVSGMMK